MAGVTRAQLPVPPVEQPRRSVHRAQLASSSGVDYVVTGLVNTVSVADAATIVASGGGASITEHDTVTTTDAAVLQLGHQITEHDTVTAVDAAQKSSAYAKTEADTVTTADQVLFGNNGAETKADSVTAADIATPAMTLARTFADTVTVADGLETPAIAENDTVSVVDVATPAMVLNRSKSDAVTVVDATAVQVSRTLSFNDSVSVADAQSQVRDFRRVFTENLTLVETIIRVDNEVHQPIVETVTTSDGHTIERALALNFNDSVGTADSISSLAFPHVTLVLPILGAPVPPDTIIALDFHEGLGTPLIVQSSIRVTVNGVQVYNGETPLAGWAQKSIPDAGVTHLLLYPPDGFAYDEPVEVDVVFNYGNIIETFADNVGVQDRATIWQGKGRSFGDSLTTADGVFIGRAPSFMRNDQVSAVDQHGFMRAISKQDTVSVADAASEVVSSGPPPMPGGRAWQNVTSPTANNLNYVYGVGQTNLVAVGDNGTIINFESFAWVDRSPVAAAGQNFLKVWCDPAGTKYWAIGTGGIMYYSTDRITWTASTTLQTARGGPTLLVGIWGASASNFWVLTFQGEFWHTTDGGSTWTNPATIPPGTQFSHMWGTDANAIIAVSADGLLAFWNGTSWQSTFGLAGNALGCWPNAHVQNFVTRDAGIEDYAYQFSGAGVEDVLPGDITFGQIRHLHGLDEQVIYAAGSNDAGDFIILRPHTPFGNPTTPQNWFEESLPFNVVQPGNSAWANPDFYNSGLLVAACAVGGNGTIWMLLGGG